MQHLSETLKKILNGLAMQHVGDYLSDEDKKANLEQVLAAIAQENKTNSPPPPSAPAIHIPFNMALNLK